MKKKKLESKFIKILEIIWFNKCTIFTAYVLIYSIYQTLFYEVPPYVQTWMLLLLILLFIVSDLESKRYKELLKEEKKSKKKGKKK